YYQGELVTAYALLEKRFGLATRRFTSIVFMVTRGMADSVRVFATAVPIALIIGPLLPQAYVMPVAVLVLGTLTVLYTIRGGMRAVVWTEILQAGVYIFGGISAAVLVGHLVSRGWSGVVRSGVAVIIQFTLFLFLGIGLWTFYAARAFPTPDAIFPTFIVDQMPHGLVGLLLAAILAATMSTHSGAINSLAAASTHDIYLPLT